MELFFFFLLTLSMVVHDSTELHHHDELCELINVLVVYSRSKVLEQTPKV